MYMCFITLNYIINYVYYNINTIYMIKYECDCCFYMLCLLYYLLTHTF